MAQPQKQAIENDKLTTLFFGSTFSSFYSIGKILLLLLLTLETLCLFAAVIAGGSRAAAIQQQQLLQQQMPPALFDIFYEELLSDLVKTGDLVSLDIIYTRH